MNVLSAYLAAVCAFISPFLLLSQPKQKHRFGNKYVRLLHCVLNIMFAPVLKIYPFPFEEGSENDIQRPEMVEFLAVVQTYKATF